MSIPITVINNIGQSGTTYVTIQMEPIEDKLNCCPSQIFLPPLPVFKSYEFEAELTLDSLVENIVLENVGFISWKKMESTEVPFRVTLRDGKRKIDEIVNCLCMLVHFHPLFFHLSI